jgi:hypothetical protein
MGGGVQEIWERKTGDVYCFLKKLLKVLKSHFISLNLPVIHKEAIFLMNSRIPHRG